MIVPIDSNIVACQVSSYETAIVRLQERNLPVEVIWQVPIDLHTRLDHFGGSVAFGTIVSRREVVLISIRIGRGRVPSAGPIQFDRDRDLY
jgi:hypothetical protein